MNHESPDSVQPLELPDAVAALDRQFRYAQVGRSVNGVTHDINNFLGAAQAYAELVLMDRGLPPESRRMVSEIVNSTVKCSQIVQAMTNIARPPERDSLNIVEATDVLTDLERLFTYTCRVARVQFTVERPPALPNILASYAKLNLAVVYLFWDTMDRLALGENEAETPTLRLSCSMDETHLAFVVAHSGAPFFEEITEHWEEAAAGLREAEKIARLHQGDLVYSPHEGYILRFYRHLTPQLGAI